MDSPSTANPEFAPLAAAAWSFGLSVKTLERRAKAGQLEVYRVGRRRLVEWAAVDRLVRSGRAVPSSHQSSPSP